MQLDKSPEVRCCLGVVYSLYVLLPSTLLVLAGDRTPVPVVQWWLCSLYTLCLTVSTSSKQRFLKYQVNEYHRRTRKIVS